MHEEYVESVDSPMQRCVDAGDLDGLLAVVSADEIAIAWHRYTATPEPKEVDHPDWWAVQFFMDSAIYQRKELHRALLLKLVEHGEEDALGNVAAGPLEDFVSDDEDDLRWLEAGCATNRRLRITLPGMWAASYVSDATMARLEAAAGEPLPRPRPESEWPPELIAFRETERHLDDVAGGISAFWKIEHPTAEQTAAAENYQVALHAMMDLSGRS